nr:MAG TPA: hypothetical protein [Caudoviricetes sp.]
MADEKNVADEAEAAGGGAPGARGDDAQVESEEQVPVEGNKGEGQDGGARKVDDLPEWAQRELKGARDEAARYRTQLREVQESVKGLKTVEEFEAAMLAADEKTRQVEAELDRVRVRQQVRDEFPNLPGKAFEFVKDGTVEEMRAACEELASLVGATGGAAGLPRKGGGLAPAEETEGEFDAAEYVRSRVPRI